MHLSLVSDAIRKREREKREKVNHRTRNNRAVREKVIVN